MVVRNVLWTDLFDFLTKKLCCFNLKIVRKGIWIRQQLLRRQTGTANSTDKKKEQNNTL